jgi:hypothetical protein
MTATVDIKHKNLNDEDSTNNSSDTKKLIANGFLNVSVLTNNIVQLKFLTTKNVWNYVNIILVVFIIICVILQFIQGNLLIFLAKKKKSNPNNNEEDTGLNGLNYGVAIMSFTISFINILLSVYLYGVQQTTAS